MMPSSVTHPFLEKNQRVNTACFLTLGLIIFGLHSLGGPLRGLLLLAMICTLIYPRTLQHPLTWVVISVIVAVNILNHWEFTDNHQYLCLYWIIALLLVVIEKNDQQRLTLLELFCRFLLVFVMGAAVYQKATSDSYISSAFFELELILDQRFHVIQQILGMFHLSIETNASSLHHYVSYPGLVENPAPLHVTQTQTQFAWILTWWDLLVQLFIAGAFIRGSKRSDMLGHCLLVVFIFTTYWIAPVLLFGFLISIWGLLLAASSNQKMVPWYLACLAALCLFTFPLEKVAGWLM